MDDFAGSTGQHNIVETSESLYKASRSFGETFFSTRRDAGIFIYLHTSERVEASEASSQVEKFSDFVLIDNTVFIDMYNFVGRLSDMFRHAAACIQRIVSDEMSGKYESCILRIIRFAQIVMELMDIIIDDVKNLIGLSKEYRRVIHRFPDMCNTRRGREKGVIVSAAYRARNELARSLDHVSEEDIGAERNAGHKLTALINDAVSLAKDIGYMLVTAADILWTLEKIGEERRRGLGRITDIAHASIECAKKAWSLDIDASRVLSDIQKGHNDED